MIKKFLILSSLIFCIAAAAQADSPNELGLDTSTNYDIYLGGVANSSPVIFKGVRIIEMRTVNNFIYLVVSTEGGSFAKHAEGLVRLDYIQAILPTFNTPSVQIYSR